jgi:hypothetical protein
MISRAALLVAVIICLACSEQRRAAAQSAAPCSEPEVILGATAYNNLVCAGIDKMQRGQFREAIHDLEQATTIRLSESPNFRLFPRLALAYFKAGDRDRANLNLELGRLSLSLLVGIYRCHQASTGFILLDQTGAPVEHPQAKEIPRRMCGAAYEYAYSKDSLEDFVRDASLVEHYLAIAKEVKGG